MQLPGRAGALWQRVRDSLWFIPGVLTACGALLALLLTEIERRGFALDGTVGAWVFGGGAAGARGVLAAIASSLITVTGVVFSVTIVALQLASSQYTPRLLRDFTADRGNQLVLGVFIGTFTYTLLVLRTVREANEGAAFVPGISVTLAIAFAIVNIGVLIFFIDHSARSIQVSTILARVTRRTLADIERRFPANVGQAASPPLFEPAGAATIVEAERSGYLQHVDDRALFSTGRTASLVIVMEVEVGAFVLRGEPLARVHGASPSKRTVDAVRSAFVLGSQRTPGHDIEFGIIELSDIAVKALSPGINDPTTALHCIHRLAEVLAFLGGRNTPDPTRSDDGAVHFIARHRPFDAIAMRAFEPIREFGGGQAMIMRALLDALGRIRARVPVARHPEIDQLVATMVATARERIDDHDDRRAIERLAADSITRSADRQMAARRPQEWHPWDSGSEPAGTPPSP